MAIKVRRPVKAAPTTRKIGKIPTSDPVKARLLAATASPAGASKAQQFALKAEAAGWTVERAIDGDRKRAICQRGDERVEVGWTKEVADGPVIGHHVYPAGSSGIKNAASALRIINGRPGEFIPSPKAKAIRTQGERKARSSSTPRPLPIDLYKASDKEVLEYVRGKKISWINSMDPENLCTGYIPRPPADPTPLPNGKMPAPKRDYTEITLSKSEDTLGERILHFLDPHIGFRALFIGAITKVGKDG